MPLANVAENDGVLAVTQSNTSACRDIRNLLTWALNCLPVVLIAYLGGRFFLRHAPDFQAQFLIGLLFISAPWWLLLIRAVTELFNRETFVFDTNKDIFIRNGFPVGSLDVVRSVRVQVGKGLTQNSRFRLVLELAGLEMIVVVITHYIPSYSEHMNSFLALANTSKQKAVFEGWADYNNQTTQPAIPTEMVELQHRILKFVATNVLV